ncbi:Thg1 C-terminal domain, partial [Dillenia turbinata]
GQDLYKGLMANSKYEYVKSFEVDDKIAMPDIIIIVRIDACNFRRFSEVHKFEKPNDEKALNLMDSCAAAILEKFPDIIFSYGFSDEYSFIFKKRTKFYKRRVSKILSLVVSLFTSMYVTKWKDFFPQKDLMYPPSFHAWVNFASMDGLQTYLAWRQNECHINNLHDTCLWMLIKGGKTEIEALDILKVGTQEQEKNEILFQQFGINYRNLPEIFRQGSCILKAKVEDIVKYNGNGIPVKRLRRKVTVAHSVNIAGRKFWNDHSSLLKELGEFTNEISEIEPDYVDYFLIKDKLIPSTWIVVRIDGCHFHRFSEVHEFEKPNDERALNLMNACAVSVLEEFQDIVFSYGVSDEYSFLLKKDSQFYQRCGRLAFSLSPSLQKHCIPNGLKAFLFISLELTPENCTCSEIVSLIVSFFSSNYAMNWKKFFPQKELKYPPSFDGRAVCYPSSEIVRDYLAWRQVDCHINNQYNTCFWMLVKSGKRKSEAQNILKGTQAKEKNDLLQQFGIAYDTLPLMFRRGSSMSKGEGAMHGYGIVTGSSQKYVVVKHCNIIERDFWEAHPEILDENRKGL